jgi:hypothetical protein
MPQIKFTDLRMRKVFTTDKFRLTAKRTKRGMVYFAVAKAPSGVDAWRIVSKDFYNKYK